MFVNLLEQQINLGQGSEQVTGPSNPSVLILAFNRPDLLRSSLRLVLKAKPPRIYVNIDGPRRGVGSDLWTVAETSRVVREETKGREVLIRQSRVNLGVTRGVIQAIDWFFEHEAQGIIIEDDVLISPTSLPLCGSLLDSLGPQGDVGSIAMFNAVPRRWIGDPSSTYRYSAIPTSWYWATWRSRWQLLETDMRQWRLRTGESDLAKIGGTRFGRLFASLLDESPIPEDMNWEGAWIGTHLLNSWRVATTNDNFAIHAGYSQESTHLTEQPSWQPTSFQTWYGILIVPESHAVDRRADRWMLNQRFALSRVKRLKQWLGLRLPWIRSSWRKYRVRPVAVRLEPLADEVGTLDD
jgi:hypothetical protein